MGRSPWSETLTRGLDNEFIEGLCWKILCEFVALPSSWFGSASWMADTRESLRWSVGLLEYSVLDFWRYSAKYCISSRQKHSSSSSSRSDIYFRLDFKGEGDLKS